ncbi:MAG: glycosyltransferase [Caldilineaceae bacterium]
MQVSEISSSVRVALVHDWLNQMGGAENVLEELMALFPGAPVYTSIYAAKRMPDAYRTWDIHTSWLNHLPGIAAHHQKFLPLYPLVFAKMDLTNYDVVISNKSGFCHGVQTSREGKRTIHICYCLTPTRYLWMFDQYRQREQIGGLVSAALQPLLQRLRTWDYEAAQRVDHFIAISREVQKRIKEIYKRTSVIIHPPVDTEFFTPAWMSDSSAAAPVESGPGAKFDDYYLIVSRLIPYKRIDLAVEAFRHLPHEKLIIAGDGRDRAALQASAPSNVSFLGRISRQQIRELLRGCKAFLFPGLEDFGIAPVEALACGRPVIAYGGGGALDTIEPARCGELFAAQDVESLLTTLQNFAPAAYDPALCRTQAEKFSHANFQRKLVGYIEQVLAVSSY